MAIVLLIIGTVMTVAAVRNTVSTNGSTEGLTQLLEGDFTGQNNYIFWLVSILVIGGAGYIPGFKNLSNAFLVLVIVVLFLSKGGFFNQFQSALESTTGTTNPSGGVIA
jgi:hypothetical protein